MKADLHVHTCFSKDGKTTMEQLVETAVAKEIGCIAVTDHNEFLAYEQLKDNGQVIIIPAEEVSSKEGHIVALGIDRLIPRGLSIQETIDKIHEAGGYAIAAHPYRWWSGLGEKNTLAYEFDGTEGKNGRSVKRDNRRSMKLAERIGKPITAGSDAHAPPRIGDSYIVLPDSITTWQEAVAFIMSDAPREAVSGSRGVLRTLKYGFKSICEWMFRGFRKMRIPNDPSGRPGETPRMTLAPASGGPSLSSIRLSARCPRSTSSRRWRGPR
jgi:hypothetical protein